jgi:hypothetical protein
MDPLDRLHPSRRIHLTTERHAEPATLEPISDPEPAPPSLDEPDPGVFHHDPTKPPPH